MEAQTGEEIARDEIFFKNGNMVFKAEFTIDNKLRCPFCSEELKQVKRHVNTKHKQLITDQAAFEQFCQEVSDKWKKQKQSKYDDKRKDKRKGARQSYFKDFDENRKEKRKSYFEYTVIILFR